MALTLRLDSDVEYALDAKARRTRRSKNQLINEALRESLGGPDSNAFSHDTWRIPAKRAWAPLAEEARPAGGPPSEAVVSELRAERL
ncbi:MAG: ribbon-helix-helix domain-containing protein [Bifidobacteriaceae bacterium]|jgi:predicted transcriptional regulator|nr:ribbon-helix-helix domain-containing protein [Bifidobacteriaceae bacterium]